MPEGGELTGGEHVVHVAEVLGFVLLGRAGHDRHEHQALALELGELRIDLLDESARHLLRRLAGRHVGDQVGPVQLDVVDPGRRATREHGEGAAGLDALHQFVRLFHDGEVGREAGVEDRIEADLLEGRGQVLEHDGHARRPVAVVGQRRGHGRGDLRDDHGVRIAQFAHDRVDLAVLHQSAGRAHPHALAAVGAARDVDAGAEAGGDLGAEAAIDEVDGPDALDLVAHGHAAPAEDALVGVTPDGRRRDVEQLVLLHAHVLLGTGAQLLSQRGQLATARPVAHEAVLGMVGHHQLHDGAPGLEQPRGVSLHLHAVGGEEGATGLQPRGAFDLDHTHAARRRGRRGPVERAQMGDVDAGARGHL